MPNNLHTLGAIFNMRGYLFLAFIIGYVCSTKIGPGKPCLTCCGKPPCCNCCGLPGCGDEIKPIISEPNPLDLVVDSIVEKPTLPNLVTKPPRPTMCLMCCGKPPCCNTCGLDINLS